MSVLETSAAAMRTAILSTLMMFAKELRYSYTR